MRKAIIVIVSGIVVFATSAVAFGVPNPPEVDEAVSTFSGSTPADATPPVICAPEGATLGAPYVMQASGLATTYHASGTDTSPNGAEGDSGDFSLTATIGDNGRNSNNSGIKITVTSTFRINGISGALIGVAAGNATIYPDNINTGNTTANRRLYGSFNAVLKGFAAGAGSDGDNAFGAGRAFTTLRLQKKLADGSWADLKEAVPGFASTPNGLVANVEFAFVQADANDPGTVSGAMGTSITPPPGVTAGNWAVKTNAKPINTNAHC